jgi:hypothetical protein
LMIWFKKGSQESEMVLLLKTKRTNQISFTAQ